MKKVSHPIKKWITQIRFSEYAPKNVLEIEKKRFIGDMKKKGRAFVEGSLRCERMTSNIYPKFILTGRFVYLGRKAVLKNPVIKKEELCQKYGAITDTCWLKNVDGRWESLCQQ